MRRFLALSVLVAFGLLLGDEGVAVAAGAGDDHGDSYLTATAINVGTVVNGQIDAAA